MTQNNIVNETKKLITLLKKTHNILAGAESCTGGLVSAYITSISGASEVFNGTIVSYTNEIKIKLLGVSENTIKEYTEVSHECVKEMAEGAKKQLKSTISYSVSGYAGPNGGTTETPTGTIFFGFHYNNKTITEKKFFSGTRNQIQQQATLYIIKKINSLLDPKRTVSIVESGILD